MERSHLVTEDFTFLHSLPPAQIFIIHRERQHAANSPSIYKLSYIYTHVLIYIVVLDMGKEDADTITSETQR